MELQKIREIATIQRDWNEKVGEITSIVIDNYNPKRNIYEAHIDLVDKTTNLNSRYTVNQNGFEQMLARIGLSNAIKDFVVYDKDKNAEIVDIDILKELIPRHTERVKTPSFVIYDDSNEAKTVKSSRYKRTHNLDVLNNTVSKYGEAITEKKSFINDNVMVLSMNECQKYDVLQNGTELWGSGIETINSEVGRSGLNISLALIRYSCSNLAIASKEVLDVEKIKHISSDMFVKLATAQADIMGRGEKVMSLIKHAIMRPATITIDKIPKLLSANGIPQRHHEYILAEFAKDPIVNINGETNNYSVYNAITRYTTHTMPSIVQDQEEIRTIMSNAYSVLAV